jgi:ATP-dependent helicase/nuclease subunit A
VDDAAKISPALSRAADAKSLLDWLWPAAQTYAGAIEVYINDLREPEVTQSGGQMPDVRVGAKDTDWIRERLFWEYPYGTKGVRAKISVSDIKAREEFTAAQGLRSGGERAGAAGAAARGTAMHEVLARIDFNYSSVCEIERFICHLVEKEILTEEQAELCDTRSLSSFLSSELAKRVRTAEILLREQPFVIPIEGSQTGVRTDETVLLQGVIDCCFLENGEWTLIDYKTDAIPPAKKNIAINRYQKQIELYREALTKCTGKNVKETHIYMLCEKYSIRIL